MTGGSAWQDLAWTLDGKPFQPEERHGLYVFRLPQPLASGASVRLGFRYRGKVLPGVSRNGGPVQLGEFILPSGVLGTGRNPDFVPKIGFDPRIGVDEINFTEPRSNPPRWYEGVTRRRPRPLGFHPAAADQRAGRIHDQFDRHPDLGRGEQRPADRGLGERLSRAGVQHRGRALAGEAGTVRHRRLLRPPPPLQRGHARLGARRRAPLVRRVVRSLSLAGAAAQRVPQLRRVRAGERHQHLLFGRGRLPDPAHPGVRPGVRDRLPRGGSSVVGAHPGGGEGPSGIDARRGGGQLRRR